MASLIHILIATALFTTVLGQTALKVTNGTHDYFKIAQAELLVKIQHSELENDALDTRFLDRLLVIEQQQYQTLNETQQVNQTIIPLQALNLVRKYCIQTYDSQFISYNSAKAKYQACITTARNVGSSLTASARSSTRSARDYAILKLPDYNRYFCYVSSIRNNQTKIENCYIENVQKATEFVQNALEKAQYYREQSVFEMNTITLEAIQCSFKIEKTVLEALFLTTKKINQCVYDLHRKNALTFGQKNKALN